MGKIRKVLAMAELQPRYITARSIWADLCENIHLHYRDARLDYSEEEWAHFRAAINHLGKGVEYTAEDKEYKEGDPNTLIQVMYNVPVHSDSKYYPNRAVLELQRDNTVHFHCRDLRLHWPLHDFLVIAQMFTNAAYAYHELKDFPGKDIKEPTRMTVPIDSVQPYDDGHRPMVIDEEHREKIEEVKELIKQGKKIRPILVDTRGQRMDGFSRYMAFVELGHKEIEVIVDPFAFMGGQMHYDLEDDGYT